MTAKPRVFLDANILIRGITFPRFPHEVLRHAANGDFVLILSPTVIHSARFYVDLRFPEDREGLEVLLGLLNYELVPDPPLEQVAAHPNLVRDAKDIPVALSAINARADYLVSTDRDFTDEDETTAELRGQITPLRPGTFLRDVMGWTSQALSSIERRRWPDLIQPFWEDPQAPKRNAGV